MAVLEIARAHVFERADGDDAGVVDQDVDAPVPFDHIMNQRLSFAWTATSHTRVTTSAPSGEFLAARSNS